MGPTLPFREIARHKLETSATAMKDADLPVARVHWQGHTVARLFIRLPTLPSTGNCDRSQCPEHWSRLLMAHASDYPKVTAVRRDVGVRHEEVSALAKMSSPRVSNNELTVG